MKIKRRSSGMNGNLRGQRGMIDLCERNLKLARSLLIAFVLLAAFVQLAASDSDPYLTVDKVATPVSGECNKYHVMLSADGAEVIKPVDVFLVLDVSGSMGYPPNPTSLQYAKDAANSFVDQVIGANPSNRVGLVKYSDIAGLVQPLTHDDLTLHAAINGLSASGFTNIDDGFYTAKVNFGSTNPCITSTAIVFLTDGVANRDRAGDSCPTWPTSPTACTLAAIASGIDAQSKATVFTVGLLGYVHTHEPASEGVARNTL